MWLVEASLAIKEIVAMYDEVNDIVYCYVYKDDFNEESPQRIGEWYPPYNHETFYKTEGAAIDYRNAKREEFKEMMPKVKAFIERMDNVESTDDFKFEKGTACYDRHFQAFQSAANTCYGYGNFRFGTQRKQHCNLCRKI